MAKIEKLKSSEPWAYNELFPILKDAFRVLYIAFQKLYNKRKSNLYKKPIKGNRYLENLFTSDLVKGTSDIVKLFEYRIQKQQQDFETNNIIDIAILYNLSFGDNSNDLKIECKRLDNINYIISDGIFSFKNNKYSENLSLGGLLLFNTKNEISHNINLLNAQIERKISPYETLDNVSIITGYQYTYKSVHKRVKNDNLILYSCVLDFSELIEW